MCVYFARELFLQGTVSPGNFFARQTISRELFPGNSFEGTFSRELFRRNSFRETLSRELFQGNSFEGTFSQGTFSNELIRKFLRGNKETGTAEPLECFRFQFRSRLK
jgi:hypothetical protein